MAIYTMAIYTMAIYTMAIYVERPEGPGVVLAT